jgi:hypothetical protein
MRDASFIALPARLNGAEERFWPMANHQILWGWKRDVGEDSRLVYYSSRLARRGGLVGAEDHFLVYKHRTGTDVADRFAQLFESRRRGLERSFGRLEVGLSRRGRRAVLRVELGHPSMADHRLVRRLEARRPRRSIGAPPHVVPAPLWDVASYLPADLYIGSGVSYESHIPTLCDMHHAFCVDHPAGDSFTHGADDALPAQLTSDPEAAVAAFCQVHVAALTAVPSPAMHTIADLHRAGLIGNVFTDNVDNLIAKTGVPFKRTRGSGVLNERCPVEFRTPRLIVIGVAADRRDVVAQARAQRRRVIIVNPCHRVAPHVRHLTYLRERDVFLKTTADEFFAAIRGELAPDGEESRRRPRIMPRPAEALVSA